MGRLVQQQETAGADRKHSAAEAEARYYAQTAVTPWRRDSTEMASGKPGAVQALAVDQHEIPSWSSPSGRDGSANGRWQTANDFKKDRAMLDHEAQATAVRARLC